MRPIYKLEPYHQHHQCFCPKHMKPSLEMFILLFFFQINFSFAQLAGSIIPKEYIEALKIKRITESDRLVNDTILRNTYFDKNGKISQITSKGYKNEVSKNEIDSCFSGNNFTFYECYTYDNKGRKNVSAASWTGLKDPYIMVTEYSYSLTGDTAYQKKTNSLTGACHILKDPNLQIIADTQVINNNCVVYLLSNKDTLYYRFQYNKNGLDSVIISRNFARSDYHYYTYKEGKLVHCGYFLYKEDDHDFLIGSFELLFDKEGLPYKSIDYHFSDKEPFTSTIGVETF